jgi:hypothetical protein
MNWFALQRPPALVIAPVKTSNYADMLRELARNGSARRTLQLHCLPELKSVIRLGDEARRLWRWQISCASVTTSTE